MTAPYINPGGSASSEQEWQDFMERHKQLVDAIMGESSTLAGQLHPQVQPAVDQTPAPVMGTQAPGAPPRLASTDELIGQARFWDIPNPERMTPQDLYNQIQQHRAEIPRDEQTTPGSAALATLGAASEAGGAAARVAGNIFGDVGAIPFAGNVLSHILGTERAKQFMYDLSQKTSEFSEAARAAQPAQDKGAYDVLSASGKIAGNALPAVLLWNAMGAAGAAVPPAWAARVASPIARAALQGGLTGAVMDVGSDEPTGSKVFNIGVGMAFGASTALPKIGASLGLGGLGYGIGSQVGDTPDERRAHGIEGLVAGLALGAAPLMVGAAARIKQDIKSPFDQAVEDQVRAMPSGQTPDQAQLQSGRRQATATATFAGTPELGGPDFETVTPPQQLLVRSDPVTSEPQIIEAPPQQAALPRAQRALPAPKPQAAPPEAGKLAGTRVVDAQGNPLTVYHGTGTDFESFDISTADPTGTFGPALYHSDSPEVAAGYPGLLGTGEFPTGANIRPAKLNIQNPWDAGKIYTQPEVDQLVGQMEQVHPDYDWDKTRKAFDPTNLLYSEHEGGYHGMEVYNILANTPPKQPTLDIHPLSAVIGRGGVNNGLEQIGFDGIVQDRGQHAIWAAFRPDQVHSPWDVAPMQMPEAATSADVLTKQATLLESQSLPEAVGKVQLSDADVVQAAKTSNPAGVSIIRGVNRPLDLMSAHPDAQFVQRGDGFDAVIGATPQQVQDYTNHGVFTGQHVVTASGLEGQVSKIGDLITVKRASGPPLRVRPENLLPGKSGAPQIQAPDLWDRFKSGLLDYANGQAREAGMAPVEDITDPRVTSIMSSQMGEMFDRMQITDPAVRQTIDQDFNQQWIMDLRDLDPEMRDTQSAVVKAAVQAHNASESSDDYNIPASMEEKAEKRGFIWVSNPGDGGTLRDTVNPGTPDFPVATDASAHEFLARVDRTLPDFTPVSDVPLDVAEHLPTDLGRDQRLTAEDHADLLNGVNQRLATTSTPEVPAGGAGGGGIVPPPPPPPPSGGGQSGWQLPPGEGPSLPEQFQRMRLTDPAKLHKLVYDFQGLMSSGIRYMRYAMLRLERRLTDAGIDMGRAWLHYENLDTARTYAFNEGQPWLNEVGDIMRQFPARILRDGTADRIHQIEDPNARMAAWYRLGTSHGLKDREIKRSITADGQLTDWWHRVFTAQTGDPNSALTQEREIHRYMPHVRARQAQGVPDPYDTGLLSPEVQHFAEYARDGNLQFRITDARETANHYIRSWMFKKHEAEPWQQLVNAWQDPRVPQPMQDFMLDWARLVRFGHDPSSELAVRGIQSLAKNVLRTPVTMREAQHLLNMPSGAMYMSMLAGRASIFFRDAVQPLLALAKIEVPHMAGVYRDILVGAKSVRSQGEDNLLRSMYQRGLDGGWIEKENPNLEAAGFFEEQPGRADELTYMTPEQAGRREFIRRLIDPLDRMPAWVARPSKSNLSTLKWYGRQGQLHRLIVGEAAYRQAATALTAYRQSQIAAVIARDPSLEMPYTQTGKLNDPSLENRSFFGSFEPPIRRRLQELVQQGDDHGAAELFAREVANWSQHRYGRREVPPTLRNNIGRALTMFGNFTGQFLEGMVSSLANGNARQKARFGMTVGTVSAAMYLLKHETGWSFDKWAWLPAGIQYVGSPWLERAAKGVAAMTGLANEAGGRQPSPFEHEALKDAFGQGFLPQVSDFMPYTGYIKSAAEYSNAAEGTNPMEQALRYTITGDRGSSIDMRRMLEEAGRQQDSAAIANQQLPPIAPSHTGVESFGFPLSDAYQIPVQPYNPAHRPDSMGAAGGTTP